MNTILLGPLLGNNRAHLIERCSNLVANGQSHKFLYLAASHSLLEVVTEDLLDGARNPGVWGELPVYLFRGFVRRILSSAIDDEGRSLRPRLPIDREELPLKRSLIAQILARLKQAGKLKAIAPLAGREGCVNTIATLIGEIQRAAKSPAEVSTIISTRTQDLAQVSDSIVSQIDFDLEVALIYSTYCELLQRNDLTENDADQLRALAALRGEIDGHNIQLPWLANIELLILDGFFDFTPIQGEILRELIPHIPETLVNLNYDIRNPEIFAPFQETIGQLCAMATFETEQSTDYAETAGVLSALRQNLFNPLMSDKLQFVDDSTQGALTDKDALTDDNDKLKHIGQSVGQAEIRYFECGDRDTEIRAIAKEIKRLVLLERYNLADIALVVRQRDTYAKTITRVMREESVPCKLESRVDVVDVPATRGALKLLELLEKPTTTDTPAFRTSDLADLIKSEFFRLSDDELAQLSTIFDSTHLELLNEDDKPPTDERLQRLKTRYRIGFWDADALENAFAYVGSDVPVNAWLSRARKLIKELPSATATKEILNIDSGAHDRDADIADQVENAETAKLEEKVEKKRRPSRDIHPATLAWTALVLQRFAELVFAVPREGSTAELRLGLMLLLDRFGFSDQITKPTRTSAETSELPQVMLNFNALESLRRALAAAIKSIEMSQMSDKLQFVDDATTDAQSTKDTFTTDNDKLKRIGHTDLPTFIAEVRRSLNAQSQLLGPADRGGLRVLEATDVRGLKFKAVFIAGLVEGGFPLRASRDWIYPHEERERLKKYGLTLEDISPATLLKEEHYFYQVACRTTERLYLSRPLVLEDDSETVASYYVNELRRAIWPNEIAAEVIRRDYEGKNLEGVSNSSELNVSLVRQQERYLHRGPKHALLPQPRIKRLLTLARNDGFLSDTALRRIEIERERAGSHFGPYDGEITDPHLLALLQRKFGADFVHSASGLSVFGNCAYRFYAQRVLKLEPRGEAALDLQAIDAGKLLHDILRRFFEQHRREPLYSLDRDQLRTELHEIADRVFDEHERVVPPLNRQIWRIDREIRKILLEQVLWYELDIQQEAEGKRVLPAFFEIAFGGTRSAAKDPESTDTPLELTRGTFVGEESIKISGQIDRVDLASDDTLVAYDYKLSVGATKEDIRSGRSLQIPIYLEALERLILPGREVAGGGYYIIRGANDRRNRGLYRASKLDYYKLHARTGSVISDDEWQEIRRGVIAEIWSFLDQMRAGKFFVNPSERYKTCRFCDFSAVCRYDRERIERKKRSSADYADYADSDRNS
ncbi:MAG TPA: PD-(D/E)XK nuclease family protein [Pyrinomonadaceae bacterium]|nr:PD-(D/E)XK nuclease family protein [Pyrinomonadaceae bacterium]